jgi:hypothetical protein
MIDLLVSHQRRALCGALFSLAVCACKAKSMQIHLNISLFSYLDRPVFDVTMNETNFMSALEHSFYGDNSVMVMQPIRTGVQLVTWRLGGAEGMPRNGELVKAINSPLLEDIPQGASWLGLHLYPDNSVEIKLSKGSPDELQTSRGRKIIAEWESKEHGR